MRTAFAIVAGMFVLTLVPSRAEDYAGVGPGTDTCAQFAQMYAASPTLAETVYFDWAQGYMSGLNIARPDNFYAALNAEATDDQKSDIRRYCDAHPLASYIAAVNTLFYSLPQKPYVRKASK